MCENNAINSSLHSDEAKTILKERLNLEYELYEFVRKRLIDQNDECQKIMKSSS